jgi:hypothetical protein
VVLALSHHPTFLGELLRSGGERSGGEPLFELLLVARLSAGVVAELVNDLSALLLGEVLQLAKLVFNILPLVACAHTAVDPDPHVSIVRVCVYA